MNNIIPLVYSACKCLANHGSEFIISHLTPSITIYSEVLHATKKGTHQQLHYINQKESKSITSLYPWKLRTTFNIQHSLSPEPSSGSRLDGIYSLRVGYRQNLTLLVTIKNYFQLKKRTIKCTS